MNPDRRQPTKPHNFNYTKAEIKQALQHELPFIMLLTVSLIIVIGLTLK